MHAFSLNITCQPTDTGTTYDQFTNVRNAPVVRLSIYWRFPETSAASMVPLGWESGPSMLGCVQIKICLLFNLYHPKWQGQNGSKWIKMDQKFQCFSRIILNTPTIWAKPTFNKPAPGAPRRARIHFQQETNMRIHLPLYRTCRCYPSSQSLMNIPAFFFAG